MQLGKELATGFVRDDAQAPGEGVAGLPREAMDAKAEPPEAAPEPEPAAAG